MTIDLSNYVSVSVSKTPSSITERNVSVIAVFTKEEANIPINKYVIYKSPSNVANDFGIDSETYKIVNAIFSQSPNILSANGYVVVIPMLTSTTVAATAGYIECKGILWENFTEITDGSLKVTVDTGEAVEYTGLDFSGIKNIDNLVSVLQTKITTVNITTDNDNIYFTSKTTGATSKVNITASETGTDLTTTNLLNIDNATLQIGQAEYTGEERLQDIIIRSQKIMFYGACIPAWIVNDGEVLPSANAIQSTFSVLMLVNSNKLYLEAETTNPYYQVQQSALNKTRCLYYGGESDPLSYVGAYTGSYLAVNYNGSNTVKNLHAKELIGILPDLTIGETELQQALGIGLDVYPSCGGVGAMYCSGANEWFDTVVGLNWLQIQLQNAGFRTLRNVPTKIAQTEEGVSMFYASYEAVLRQARNAGFIAPGSWTLPFTFGNSDDLKDNITNYGYYIYFEPIATQSTEDREARRCPLCQIAIKLAGCLNSSNIIVFVNN